MQLARGGFDVGLFTNALEPQLAFWQQRLGLAFDHMGRLGGGIRQHRHHLGEAILKLNHAREALPGLPATGYRELIVAGDVAVAQPLVDPDGNRVTLVPRGARGVTSYGLVVSAAEPAAHDRFYREVIGLACLAPGVYAAGAARLFVEAGPRVADSADWRGPGYRYLTFQVVDARAAFAAARAVGAAIGAELVDFGDLVRFGFVRDPEGNWIELSERTTFTGRPLAP
ncbi:MAG: VOC family protein [Gammaproteobacteria bacterium]|nr:VOC family protein [Gammaproteobacteria bacterium]MBI5615550.1 VOC family protein [Gammaproteobacteria bacterium]